MTPCVSLSSDKMTSILRDQERNQGRKWVGGRGWDEGGGRKGIEGSGWAVMVEVGSQHAALLTRTTEAPA